VSLFLANTTDKLQLVTDAAVTVDVQVSYTDHNAGAFTPSRQLTAITTATTTDILAAPASSTQRSVRLMTIRNKHASSAVVVTLLYDANGTDYELYSTTMLAGECLVYIDALGFFLNKANPLENPVVVKRLSADQSNSTTTPTEVTGLTVATNTGTFIFEYFLILQSAATTTGHKLSANYDGTVTSFVAFLNWLTAATLASDDVPDQDHVAAPGGVFSGFSARAKSTAGWGQTTDVDTANADVLYYLSGIMVVSVAGNMELWHGSEAAAQSTVKAGSSLRLTKTA
jgi:hypothetical protein